MFLATVETSSNSMSVSRHDYQSTPQRLARAGHSLLDLYTVLPGSIPQGQDKFDQCITSFDGMCQTSLARLLIYSTMNRFAGLKDVPAGGVVKFLAQWGEMNTLLMKFLKTNTSYIARALAENPFRVAVEEGEHNIIGPLLATGLIDVNGAVFLHEGKIYTAIECAVTHGYVSVVELLLNANADPNRTFRTSRIGELILHIDNADGNQITAQWLRTWNALWQLQINGIETRWEKSNSMMSTEWTIEAVQLCVSSFSLAEHSTLIKIGFLGKIASTLGETDATAALQRILEDCEKTDCGKCFERYPQQVSQAAVFAATQGYVNFVALLLPFCIDSWTTMVLSASIRSGRSGLSTLALAHIKEFNLPPLGTEDPSYITHLNLRSPFAESILANDHPLVCRLEAAGALERMDHSNIEDTLVSAVSMGDAYCVRKILAHCPSIPPRAMTPALVCAIQKNYVELAFKLMDAGANVNGYGQFQFTKHTTPLDAAVTQRNSKLVRGILNSDIGSRKVSTAGALQAFQWGDKSIIDDLTQKLINPSFVLEILNEEYYDMFDVALPLMNLARNDLTKCLKIAVDKENLPIVQLLLEQNADASYKDVLAAAAKGHSTVLSIEEGVKNLDCVEVLLSSTIVDLDGCFLHGRTRKTPLGVAIRHSEFDNDPEFIMIKRLLDSGYKLDKIALIEDGPQSIISQSALVLAIGTRNEALVRLLVERDADVHTTVRFTVKQTPLQKAAETGSLGIVRLLLEHDADVNAAPAVRSGGTALQFAALSGNCNIAAELLSRGAYLYAPPSKVNGRWPIEGAAEHGRLHMIEYLWKAKENSSPVEDCETGFEEKHCRRAMELAEGNGHLVCRDLIAELAGLQVEKA
ncbi:ankyrin repeat-containing domain protein [Hypoxylon crocopeplum]|nr:ankyrin repeat-containing domain protein [Hypoxylon crocopeplum]